MDEITATERLKKQYARQNEFIKLKYDRIALTTPAGTKDRIKAIIGESASVNAWIYALIDKELKRQEKKQGVQPSKDQDKKL